jgi:hypothetical protein
MLAEFTSITPSGPGGSASFASLTGAPADNAALASSLGAKLNLTGGTLTGALGVTLTGLGTTPTAGFTLANSSSATAGVTAQVSPSFIFEGQGWKTDATAASQIVRFRQNILPVQGAANPSVTWRLQSEIANNNTWTDRLTVDSGGNLTLGIGGSITLRGTGANSIIAPSGFGDAINIDRSVNVSGAVYSTRFATRGTGWNFVNGSSSYYGWSDSNDGAGGTVDLFISRRASSSLQLGLNSATPVAQTLGVGAGSGTNISGASFTLAAGAGTGTGTPGSILFQTATAVGSGATAQTLTTRMTLGVQDLVMASGVGIQLGNAAVAATPTATHTVTIKDQTGTTYRLLCVV